MKDDLISFKGVKEGVFLNVNGADLLIIKKELDKKMKNAPNFYKGIKLLGIKSEGLSYEDLVELKLILKYKYDLVVSEEELPDYILNPKLKIHEDNKELDTIPDSTFDGIDCGMTKYINGTLRSGQTVDYDGNIVIIGDVNPGALIKAKGNIIVLGTIRGVAHAGICGNLNAIVAAYNLQPMQLRIGDIIARPPDEQSEIYKVPEVAKIKDGEVIIEPYLPNK
ncbi:septum site-determining protein MinC [Tissierella pigra]|uniref:Probable septum site-determining protein MinC n=1 Tax=Tissierella pigra TaxID=2607614 RepID=A0A6N7Y1Z8_9FIRM|nr:septum site-determining protein MinC [Tissierella pigra]MBU5427213.1 septum site-determining protein MinC [Tissierella pigra]MSU02864.1 septum site-determining protein MinC [Tissierella pigra]